MKHRVVVTGLGLVTPLGNTVEATFTTLPTRNATWIMWRTKRARRLWSTRSRTVSASAVRTRHSFSDALRSEQTSSAEFARGDGKRGHSARSQQSSSLITTCKHASGRTRETCGRIRSQRPTFTSIQ
jgi:3-oxoacyl-(acyl-carrier-protein) synthase